MTNAQMSRQEKRLSLMASIRTSVSFVRQLILLEKGMKGFIG
ncbi:hypothetical protein GGI1_00125 [Acidithiobacillus sp. GGI-221]|nr:hypothetical protein GGI1_00125 [Acidithiobacillus sp. GGI-221]